jgi:hypothetical protein
MKASRVGSNELRDWGAPQLSAQIQIGCWRHRTKQTSILGHWDIERVHVGLCTGLPHDRSRAAI